ncbi:hypothetical protein [Massilia sp. erpn]|uniref:hypothetical protein n=1 Tax=Massilia sp. erpn TaxID=2738142 RepID=UPI002107C3C3|nr:hypothetical protein [Massilia sp. erpn]UTY57992.1 hypothetical protein HPQ68_12850 [Massilia sp. erpn]
MNSHLIFIAAIFASPPLLQAEEKRTEDWDAKPTPLKGDYQVYGGTLSEMRPPSRIDRKVAFMFTGALAKELFDRIGPDAKLSCSDAQDYRERNRQDLSCTHTKAQGYVCYFGLDVTTGKSTRGSIC